MSDPVFFAPSRRFTVAEIADVTGAVLSDVARGAVDILTIAPILSGGLGSLVFAEGKKNAAALRSCQASAVLCSEDLASHVPVGVAVLVTPRPQRAFAEIGRLLFPDAATPVGVTGSPGLSPDAHIHALARLEAGVTVEAGAVIGAGAAIGAGTIIAANAVIGQSCQIGRDCYVGPNASVLYALVGNRVIIHAGARIGTDGFGFTGGRTGPERIPQIGRVILQDNVEIGANSAVDRGAMSDTVVGENTKIDNLVQIAHNVRMGRNCLIAGRTGISGSVTVGEGVRMGGGVGLADHLTIGDGATLAAGGGFMHDVPAGEMWAGFPAKPMGQAMREFAAVTRLAKRRPQAENGNV